MGVFLWQHVLAILILINCDAVPEEFPVVMAILEWFHFCGELLPSLDVPFVISLVCLLFQIMVFLSEKLMLFVVHGAELLLGECQVALDILESIKTKLERLLSLMTQLT